MVANGTKDDSPFTVENNIHKGRMVSFQTEYKGIGGMIWDKIQNVGNKTAQLDARTQEVVTFAEIQKKSVRCALWLQDQGIKYGDVISVCTHNHVNSFIPCVAASYINAIFNPWDEDMNLQTALHFMHMTAPKVIFCNEKSANVIFTAMERIDSNVTVVVFGSYPNAMPFSDILQSYSDSDVKKFRYIEPNNIRDTACIVHSSGTTGMPKGAELSNYGLLQSVQEASLNMNDTVPIWFSSLYWISGLLLSLKAIYNGCKIIIYPEFDEETTCKLIEKYKVTWGFLGTSMLNRLLRSGYLEKYSLPSLKIIFFGGASLKEKSQEEIRRILPHVMALQGYGMTEMGGVITTQKSNHKNGSCGTPTQNVQVKIVDLTNGKALEPNQIGELWAKTDTLMNGYYKNPEATKNFVDEDGWVHTGDLAYFDEDGELYIAERLKELIKYRGHQITPAEVEAVLLLHPGVLEVGVVAVPHAIDDEHPIAYVTRKRGSKVTEQELIDFVANNMMDHHRLRAGVVFLDTFPYTASGKISKKELKLMAKQLAVE